jgi:drug/metabolite transporter (DMT)-like permease
VIFALAAALSWGLADFMGAVSTRRVGLLLTMCTGQVVTLAVFGIVGASMSGAVHLGWADLAALVLSGILGAASYAGFYRALQLGPVSLVSPIFSAYAVITVLLAVALGLDIAAAAAAGIVITIGGVVLASASGQAGQGRPGQGGPEQGGPGERAGPRMGIWLALASMVCWGVTTYILGRSAERLGWFVPVAASRVVTFAILLAATAAAALGHRLHRPRPGALALPAVAGLFDVLAFLAYTRASQGGSVAVSAAASACFPLVVIAGGVLVFGERLRRVQVLGVSLTIVGLFVLGVGR